MSARTVFAPSRANASALALPIPEAAPVTKATLPSNCLVISPLPGKVGLINRRRFLGSPGKPDRNERPAGSHGGGSPPPPSLVPPPDPPGSDRADVTRRYL